MKTKSVTLSSISIILSFLLLSCSGNDEPDIVSKEIYTGEFLDETPSNGILSPGINTAFSDFLKTVAKYTETVEDKVVTLDGGKSIVRKYRLEIEDTKAKMTIEESGKGSHLCYNERTTSILFADGEYETQNGNYTIVYKITSEWIKPYYKMGVELYPTSEEVHNPIEYSVIIGDSWLEDYTLEAAKNTYNLSVGHVNDYKYILSDDTFEYEFNPMSGCLIQTKPEQQEIGNLDKVK